MVSKRNSNLVIVAVAGFLALCGPVWAIDGNEPVAHWKFEEGEGTIAYDSAGNNDGTLFGDPNWVAGQIGSYALDFDGNGDYVDLDGSIGNIEGWNEGTIAGWFRVDEDRPHVIFSITEGSASYNRMHVGVGPGPATYGDIGFGFVVRRGGDTKLAMMIRNGEYYYTDGAWHHFAVTTGAGDNRIYIDGVSQIITFLDGSSSTNEFSNINNPTDMRISSRRRVNSDEFFVNGKIDDVRIYNRALSAEEVEELYHGQLLSLEMVGPDVVAENFQAQYKAITHYERASIDVTDSADWSVEPEAIAGIDATGMLTTEVINRPQEAITIYAQYTEDDNTVEAEKAVSVFAVCPSGYVLEFDGVDDYVDLANPFVSVTASVSKTITGWAKSNVINYATHGGRVVSLYKNSATTGFAIFADGAPATWKGRYRKTGDTPQSLDSGIPVTVAKWTHVALVQNGSDVHLYIDGSIGNSTSNSVAPLVSSPPNSSVGAYVDSAEIKHLFTGRIDDVRIYNRALSAEEIWGLMLDGPEVDEPNLVGYWSFDEGEGQIVYDLSGNGNDGQLGSTPEADDSDPAWVESDAPVGICTMPEVIERNISDALSIKLNILEEIEAALLKENAAIDMLNELFRSREYGDLNKGDIVKSKHKIRWATQHQEQSKEALDRGIEKLEDSLMALGWEPPGDEPTEE